MKHTFTREELVDKIHPAASVVRATGISPTDLQQLCNRKVLMFSSVKFGGRTFRRFSLLEVLTVATLETIRKFNLDYSRADAIISGIRQTIGQYCQPERYPNIQRFVMFFDHQTFAGDQLFFPAESPVGNLTGYGAKAAIVIDLEQIISDAVSKLMAEEESVADEGF